jgi:predicted RNase H-like HicB family nuclease
MKVRGITVELSFCHDECEWFVIVSSVAGICSQVGGTYEDMSQRYEGVIQGIETALPVGVA